jgi:probable F420-dependent oxidoreductase
MLERPFRFGVVLTQASSGQVWVDRARRVEDLGYDVLAMPDHFGDQLAPIAGLTAAAAATRSLRLSSLVFANDFRHPVVLAKEAATLDLLSDGRFELGLGAGWLKSEYDQAGLSFDAPGSRVDRLAEALQVVKGLWSEGAFSFSGRYYDITELDGRPKPLRASPAGRPPILVGAGGRRMLRLAAAEADIVGLVPTVQASGAGLNRRDVATASVRRKVALLREAAGPRFDDLELQALVFAVRITADRRAAAEELGPRFGVPPALVLDSPHLLVGSVDEIVEQLLTNRRGLGISYVTVFGDQLQPFAPVVARLAGR